MGTADMNDVTPTNLSYRLAIMAEQLDAFVSTTGLATEDRATLNDLAHTLQATSHDAAALETQIANMAQLAIEGGADADRGVHLWLLRAVLACPQAAPWLSRLPSINEGVSLHEAIVAAVGEG